MEQVTQSQIKKLHVLFNNLQLLDEKKTIIRELTNGRTESTKGLNIKEAQSLINRLCEYLPCEKLKNSIRNLAYRAGMIYGSSETDRILNRVKIDVFLKERGAVKKDLEKQNYQELVQTHRQFEAILKNSKKTNNNREAKKAVSTLLHELNLTIQ